MAEAKADVVTDPTAEAEDTDTDESELEVEDTECGFCLGKRDELEEPKVLPCTHVHCFRCLRDSYELNHVIQCPLTRCRKIHSMTLASLPDSVYKSCGPLNCDVCSKKGQGEEPAVIYCKTCIKKYCESHQQDHDNLLDDHTTVDISEYKMEAGKLKVQPCKIHPEERYTLGCEICRRIYCLTCSKTIGLCTTGKPHTLLPADELMSALNEKMDRSKVGLTTKEEDIEKYFKTISRVSSEFDDETDEMVKTLRQTRDQQLEAIRQKYEKQETEFLQKRQKTKKQMEEFLGSTLASKWNEFRNKRLRIFAKTEHGTEYNQVVRFNTVLAEVDKYMEVEIPALELSDVVKLNVGDENQIAETVITTDPEMLFHPQGLASVVAVPAKSCSLVKSVDILSNPLGITAHGDTTFVTLESPAVAMSIDFSSEPKQFSNRNVDYCLCDENRVFALHATAQEMSVCDMDGKVVNKWRYNKLYQANIKAAIQFAVVSGKIVIPAVGMQKLLVCSETGTHVKRIQLRNFDVVYLTTTCGLKNDAVVLASPEKSEVVKVDISKGDVVWKCTSISKPQGMAYDGNKWLYVYSGSDSNIYIVNVNTGGVQDYVIDLQPDTQNQNVYDLHVSGDQLIVPLFGASKLLYYKMRKV